VVIKVEVSDQGVNTRLVVTDLEQARTKVLYQQIDCARGQAENESKDHKRFLKSDRTSCHRFEANQWRVFLHAAACVLLETLRRGSSGPPSSATMERSSDASNSVPVCEFEADHCAFPRRAPVAPVLRHSLNLLAGGRST
jgi:hypothetical protein